MNYRILLLTIGIFFATNSNAQNGTCLTADPLCSGSVMTVPAGVNTGTAEVGPDYGCLLTQPNPAWYYMEISTGGNLDIEITNSYNEDIDFITVTLDFIFKGIIIFWGHNSLVLLSLRVHNSRKKISL